MLLEEVIAEFHRFGIPKLKERSLDLPLNLNKAITLVGLRRTGKTYLLYQTIQKLIERGMRMEQIFYINFEDERIGNMDSKDLSQIVEIYRKYNPDAKSMYLFLDEIQNVKGWEKFVRRLLERRNARLFITGSSSKLLSKEIATTLRGRSLSYHLFPLSFKEFLKFKEFKLREPLIEDDRGMIKKYLDEYTNFGGFPEIVNYEEILKIRTLQEYLDLIVYKDLVERYGIKKIGVMKALIKATVKNFGNRISVKKLYNSLGSGNELSKNKIYEYFSYLDDIGFVIPVRKFSYSEIESMRSMPKLYVVDNGFPTLYGMKDMGRRIENIVAVELMRRKYYYNPTQEFAYYMAGNKEVDFVVYEGQRVKELIQVCYDVSDINTKNREIDALIRASKELKCNDLKIITWDHEGQEEVEGKKIEYVPLWKWLLE
ncbi:hypothetical protein ABOONEI_475 [Aciduliprofundum boonei T469]|nr:hypothetical protein ABOONEI_475 [Aciduliprofundum boonei T469]